MNIRFSWCRAITYAAFTLLYLPVAILIIMSFNASRFGSSWDGFTLDWYRSLFHEPSLWHAFVNSFVVATYSSLCATSIGVMAALSLHRYKSFFQRMHLGLLVAPLVMPDVLMGICLLLLFISLHIKLSLMTVFLAHTTFSISYVTMIVRSRLEMLDTSVIEAARDLGATSYQVFKKVLFPFLLPGIVAGALLAFTLSLDDFVITFFVVGPGATTLPVYYQCSFHSPPCFHRSCYNRVLSPNRGRAFIK
jgi:spermidine/putrescine transport system permease protein